MKVRLRSVNYFAVWDKHVGIIIIRKPKRRYRTIVRAYYKRKLSELRKD